MNKNIKLKGHRMDDQQDLGILYLDQIWKELDFTKKFI